MAITAKHQGPPVLNASPLPVDFTASPPLCADVVMVGSGISGLFCALKLADAGKKVVILTKNALTENNSRYAQGGIAAVLPECGEDSIAAHNTDTLVAGAGLCEPTIVDAILRDGHLAIADLLLLGVPFDRDEYGNLATTLEGGHHARRILHAGGDATGKQVEMTLNRHIENHANVTCIPHCQVVRLLQNAQQHCIGVDAVASKTGKGIRLLAKHTVLATGGAGRLFAHTTNPAGATGNGFVLAAQAGATLVDMAFIQFHPTGLVHKGQTKFLMSEALRGEGGILRDKAGQPIMEGVHLLKDLAPRDIVARTIEATMKRDGTDTVWLDMTHVSAEHIEERFPTLLEGALHYGIDMRTTPIPVAPAAHYIMGGVAVNLDGETAVPGLVAIGETVWTGLHGANRLASNSLLECVVIARNVAETLGKLPSSTLPKLEDVMPDNRTYLWQEDANECADDFSDSAFGAFQQRFRTAMSQQVGIVRHADELTTMQAALTAMQQELMDNNWHTLAPWGVDMAQQLQLAQWVVQHAFNRTESRGAHTRSDAPTTEPQPRHQRMTLNGVGTAVYDWQPVGQITTEPLTMVGA